MLRTLDLNTAVERNTAHAFTIQTMARLSPKDASLPQVLATCEMVKRGIGIHHGGLLVRDRFYFVCHLTNIDLTFLYD